MIDLDPRLLIAVLLLIFTFYGIGFFDGRSKSQKNEAILATAVADLEERVSTLNTRLQHDPTRAALDHGMVYVVNQIEELCHHIRDTIEGRISQERESRE